MEIDPTDPRSLRFTFEFETTLKNAKITILDTNKSLKSVDMLLPLELKNRNHLPSPLEYKNGNLILQNPSIEITPINLEVSSGQKLVESTTKPTSYAVSTTAGLLIVSNPTSGMTMVKLMQYFEILRYVNVEDIPDIFFAFLDIFSSNFFDFVPNPFKFDETDPTLVEKFKEIQD